MNKPLKTGDRFEIKRQNDVLMSCFFTTDEWYKRGEDTKTAYISWLRNLDIGVEVDNFNFIRESLQSTWYKVVDGPKYLIYVLRGEVKKQMLVW